jgi:hypothetical protein
MRAVDETLQPRLTAEQLKHAFEVSESNEALWTSLSTVDGQVDLKAMQSHFNSALQTLHQKFRALQQLGNVLLSLIVLSICFQLIELHCIQIMRPHCPSPHCS